MKKRLVVFGLPILIILVLVIVNHEEISAGLEEGVLNVLEAAFPPDFGPVQELESGWAVVAPTLDGILSDGEWAGAAVVEIDATDKSRPGVASGNSNTVNLRETRGIIPYSSNHATVYFMNDANNIYVAVDVTDDILDFAADRDDTIWQKDSVEIRVDGNFSRRWSKEDNRFGGSPIILGDGKRVRNAGPYIESAAAAKPDGSGYVVEVRWDSKDFAETIGFDVAINDSDDPKIGNRHAQYYWNGREDGGWTNEREWGVVHLAGETASTGPSVNSPKADSPE